MQRRVAAPTTPEAGLRRSLSASRPTSASIEVSPPAERLNPLRPIAFAVVSTLAMSLAFRLVNGKLGDDPLEALPISQSPSLPLRALQPRNPNLNPTRALCSELILFDPEQATQAGVSSRAFTEDILAMLLSADLASDFGFAIAPTKKHRWKYDCGSGAAWNCYFEPLEEFCNENEQLKPIATLPLDESKCKKGLGGSRPNFNGTHSCIVLGGDSDESFMLSRLSLGTIDKSAEDPLDHIRQVAEDVWRTTPLVDQALEKTMGRLGLDLGGSKPVYGLDIRKSSPAEQPTDVQISKYVEALLILSGPDPDVVFVATDCDDVAAKVAAKLPNTRVVSLASTSSAAHMEEKLLTENYHPEQAKIFDTIAEMEVLAATDAFVGKFSTPTSRLAQILRSQLPNTSVSLDIAWHYAPVANHQLPRKSYCDDMVHANLDYCRSKQAVRAPTD